MDLSQSSFYTPCLNLVVHWQKQDCLLLSKTEIPFCTENFIFVRKTSFRFLIRFYTIFKHERTNLLSTPERLCKEDLLFFYGIIYLYAFNRFTKCTHFLLVMVSLVLNIFFHDINWSTAYCQKTKTFKPKHFFP